MPIVYPMGIRDICLDMSPGYIQETLYLFFIPPREYISNLNLDQDDSFLFADCKSAATAIAV